MFAVFTRTAWTLLEPSSLIVLALLYGLYQLLRGRTKRARLWLLGSVAVLLITGLSQLGNILVTPLENRFSRPDLTDAHIDGIITIGGAEMENIFSARNSIAVNDAAARYLETVALAIKFPQARVVFSGGGEVLKKSVQPEAALAARIFKDLGIASDRVTLEDQSRTTWENALFTSRLIEQKPGERWLLVTSAWQMPRAMGAFRKAGLKVEAYPVDYRSTGRYDIWPLHTSLSDGLRLFDYVLREYPGLFVYWLSGRSTALFPAP